MIYVKSNTQNDLPHNQLQLLVHAPAFQQVAIITVVTVPSTGKCLTAVARRKNKFSTS